LDFQPKVTKDQIWLHSQFQTLIIILQRITSLSILTIHQSSSFTWLIVRSELSSSIKNTSIHPIVKTQMEVQ